MHCFTILGGKCPYCNQGAVRAVPDHFLGMMLAAGTSPYQDCDGMESRSFEMMGNVMGCNAASGCAM